MSSPWDIIILGCGRLGGNLKTALESEKLHVLGVRRRPVPGDPTFIDLDLDLAQSWDQLAQLPLTQHAVIIAAVTPDARTEDAYRERYVVASAPSISITFRSAASSNMGEFDGCLRPAPSR